MFPAHSPEQATIARQLADELASYEEGLRLLLQHRWDPERYRQLSDQFDRMQMFAQALPRIATSWSELVITRVELTQAVWMVHTPAHVSDSVLSAHARHEEIIREVRAKCRRYLRD